MRIARRQVEDANRNKMKVALNTAQQLLRCREIWPDDECPAGRAARADKISRRKLLVGFGELSIRGLFKPLLPGTCRLRRHVAKLFLPQLKHAARSRIVRIAEVLLNF